MDRVCHFEIPYSDKARMESFYSKVFGWQFMAAPGGNVIGLWLPLHKR